jgi:hypothetical protein
MTKYSGGVSAGSVNLTDESSSTIGCLTSCCTSVAVCLVTVVLTKVVVVSLTAPSFFRWLKKQLTEIFFWRQNSEMVKPLFCWSSMICRHWSGLRNYLIAFSIFNVGVSLLRFYNPFNVLFTARLRKTGFTVEEQRIDFVRDK